MTVEVAPRCEVPQVCLRECMCVIVESVWDSSLSYLDLLPAAVERGYLVGYTNLWDNRSAPESALVRAYTATSHRLTHLLICDDEMEQRLSDYL